MSCGIHAKLVPSSSVLGQAITLSNMPGDPVFAQLVVMAPQPQRIKLPEDAT